MTHWIMFQFSYTAVRSFPPVSFLQSVTVTNLTFVSHCHLEKQRHILSSHSLAFNLFQNSHELDFKKE